MTITTFPNATGIVVFFHGKIAYVVCVTPINEIVLPKKKKKNTFLNTYYRISDLIFTPGKIFLCISPKGKDEERDSSGIT